jgi:hypothetical protein
MDAALVGLADIFEFYARHRQPILASSHSDLHIRDVEKKMVRDRPMAVNQAWGRENVSVGGFVSAALIQMDN